MDERSAKNWRHIWEKKGAGASVPRQVGAAAPYPSLADLLSLSGFDTGFGTVTEANLRCYVARIVERLGCRAPASLLEIGCGAGLFYELIAARPARYCGVDYARPLVELAALRHPNGFFLNIEAGLIDRVCGEFDHIVANSVFQYFSSYGYAGDVLLKAYRLLRAGGSMAVLDLNDAARQDRFYQIRRAHFPDPAEFERRYGGLEQLFFAKEQLRADCLEIGFRGVEIEDQCIEGYANNAYRFNLFLEK